MSKNRSEAPVAAHAQPPGPLGRHEPGDFGPQFIEGAKSERAASSSKARMASTAPDPG
jgi:hypothetical protein